MPWWRRCAHNQTEYDGGQDGRADGQTDMQTDRRAGLALHLTYTTLVDMNGYLLWR